MALANTVTVNLHNPTFREVDDLGVNGAAVQFSNDLIGGVTMLGDPQSIADELHKAAAYMDDLLERRWRAQHPQLALREERERIADAVCDGSEMPDRAEVES
jgi:hypothetical protein